MTVHPLDRPQPATRFPSGSAAIAEASAGFGFPSALPQPRAKPALGGWQKRAIDIGISLAGLILLLPLMLMIAAVVKLTMGGPVIFAQRRVGLNGEMFSCRKFRSMVVDGDAVLSRHLARNARAAEEWRTTRKLSSDPRVTWFGNLMRKSSLDELPQLYNILIGEMSCVGPRPVMADEIDRYGVHAAAYFSTRPGLTGLWQVSGRSRLSYEERVALDADYVRTWSVWGDVKILAWTVPAVMAVGETA